MTTVYSNSYFQNDWAYNYINQSQQINKSFEQLSENKDASSLSGKKYPGKKADNLSVTKYEFTASFQLYDDGIVRLIYAGDEACDDVSSIKYHTPLLCCCQAYISWL